MDSLPSTIEDKDGKSFTSIGYFDNFFNKSLFLTADKDGIANKRILAPLFLIIDF